MTPLKESAAAVIHAHAGDAALAVETLIRERDAARAHAEELRDGLEQLSARLDRLERKHVHLIGRAVCRVLGIHRITQRGLWQHGEIRGWVDRCERCGEEWEVRP